MKRERYQRHSLVDWFDQEKLAASSVAVIGAGAIGNEVLKNLCLLGVGHVHIVDFDRIEEHNLTRTVLFQPADVGRFKAEAAAVACQKLDPNARVTFSNSDFWESLSLADLRGFQAVFCCVDNFGARIRLNQLCRLARVDFFNAGIDSRHVSVEQYPFGTEPGCACYECWLPPGAYATMRRRYSCGWLQRIAFEERKVPTTAITSSLAGATLASLFLQRRCDHPDRLAGSQKFTLDSVSLASSVTAISTYDLCPACTQFRADCHCFRVKRHALGQELTHRLPDQDFTVFLSEPIVLDSRCTLCDRKSDIFDLAARHDERLAECPTCRQPSNVLRIVDALAYGELRTAFADRPLPVKFIHFHDREQQFLLELED
jgi:molybdopterin/thiamine biosynthesis adenylyltransferase